MFVQIINITVLGRRYWYMKWMMSVSQGWDAVTETTLRKLPLSALGSTSVSYSGECSKVPPNTGKYIVLFEGWHRLV